MPNEIIIGTVYIYFDSVEFSEMVKESFLYDNISIKHLFQERHLLVAGEVIWVISK